MSVTVVNKYHLYLESTKRASGTNENAYYNLRRPIFKSSPFNYFDVSVVQANVPYSFFNITDQNGDYNSMQWYLARGGSYPSTTYIYGSPSAPKTVKVPNGNYTILSLITAIQTGIIADLVANYPSFSNPQWTWTYDRDTLNVNFYMTASDATTTTFYFMPSSVSHGGLAYNMGISTLLSYGYDNFGVPQPINIIDGVKTAGANSDSAINVAPITSLLVRSSSFQQNRSYEWIAITDDISDIMIRLPIQTVGTTFIQYVNEGNISNQVKNEYIDQINLYLTDNRSYNPISLAGLSWMCVLEIKEIEGHENHDNEAYQMMKQVDFSTGNIKSIQQS